MQRGRKIWRKRREEQEGWIRYKVGKDRALRWGTNGRIRTSDRFSVLETEGEEEKKEVRCPMAGDSRARPLLNRFCEKDRCVVKPGALVSDTDATIQEELTRYNER